VLGKVNLSQKVKKKIFKQRLPQLQTQLSELQMAAWQAGLPVIVVFEGWDGAGIGACLQQLTAGLDPRRFKLHAIREASLSETRKP
jgi:polyphosphate kinase 2 (PPK2 family)